MKQVLITGASSGIGFETAIIFAEKGYRIIALSRNVLGLKKIQEKIGNTHLFIKFDLTQTEKIPQFILNLKKQAGSIDILINNAGVGLFKKLEDVSDKEITQVISVNLLAPMILCREIIPLMKENGGTIVNIASVAGKRTWKHLSIYSASKFGLIGLSNSLRREFAYYHYPISVVVVCPPVTNTPFFENAGYSDYKKDHPGQNLISSQEVARIIYEATIKKKREVIITGRAKILDKAAALFPRLTESLEDNLRKMK